MIRSNFTLTPDNIGVELAGDYFDLHNNYDFMGYEMRDGDVRLKLAQDRWGLGIGSLVGQLWPADARHQIPGGQGRAVRRA